MELSTMKKIKILSENGLLPLPNHQINGCLLEKKRQLVDTVNYKTGEKLKVERRVFTKVENNWEKNF